MAHSAQNHQRQPTRHAPPAPPGARDSGAGDQFHLLYAARRALALLDPSSGLRRLRLEGLYPGDPAAATPELLQGIDLTEYFAGASFQAAAAVVVSQMKYSQRNPSKAWTAARLCESNRTNGPSVVSRLAEAYTAFRRSHSRSDVLARVKLRLVSNQPLGSRLRTSLDAAQGLIQNGDASTASQLLGNLQSRERTDIQRLVNCAALSDRHFVDFLRLLDLSECGAAARSLQEARLAIALRQHFPGDPGAALDRLYRRVEAEVLPETEHSHGLTRSEILVAFELDSERALLPVPAQFERPAQVVPTPDAERLATELTTNSAPFVVAHGNAGVGKTTTILELERMLPPGSVVITYDCFGGGSYLDPAEGRHRPERAVFQLTNDLAVRCGTPLLLRAPSLVAELWRVFRDRASEEDGSVGRE